MASYYIWTIGCQMNKAESQWIAGYLESAGYQAAISFHEADLVVLNTCVVRRSAEDRVLGTLGLMGGLKRRRPHLSILVTGCFVDSDIERLKGRFPHVDFFFKPGAYSELTTWFQRRGMTVAEQEVLRRVYTGRDSSVAESALSGEIPPPYFVRGRNDKMRRVQGQNDRGSEGLPENDVEWKARNDTREGPSPCAFVPIIQGCDNFCSYCIVPYRRGRERSRPLEEIVCEVKALVEQGVKEVTLLGQNVDSYGHDLPEHPDLADLLTGLNDIDGLARIRFLTNHPKDMSLKLIEAVASLDKVCEHLELAVQAGDNDILKLMRRGYAVEQYRELVQAIRSHIPRISLSTDVIVGFPGETEEQFEHTFRLLEETRFDVVHSAAYSPRPGTIAWRKYEDDIPPEVKKRRLKKIEELQASVAGEINSQLLGKTVEVLVEGKKKGKWYGRSRSDKLVFFADAANWQGQLVEIRIEKTSPWSLQGRAQYKS
ncbi:MAG: MiaB/RimO family radical SAM methylthiotransferase [Dehalococcoidia bacterium]|nr:MiaB/RimO family radical SAM methylthiotransferase [Dehalococcoidia bacterium]